VTGFPLMVFDLTFPQVQTGAIISGLQLTLQPSGGGMVFRSVVEIYPMTITAPANNGIKIHYDAGPLNPVVSWSFVAPPPPPPFTASGTKMPPAASIVDNVGAMWTIGALCGTDGKAGQVSVFRNGVRQFCSSDFVTIDNAGVVWVSDFGSGPGWQKCNPGCVATPSTPQF